MVVRDSPALALGAEETAFLQIEHLSILASSCGPDHVPALARAVGRRFSPDVRRLTLLFPASDAREMLSHFAANGRIAAVFALPVTHQALQLKGSDARVEKPARNDWKLVVSYRRAFVGHLVELGYPREVFEALLDCEPDDLAAVSFTPSAAFSQTPGPRAGHTIGAAR